MKNYFKIFIFMPLTQMHPTQRCISKLKAFREPLYFYYPFALELGVVFLQGLFICSCFQMIDLSVKTLFASAWCRGLQHLKVPKTYNRNIIWFRSRLMRGKQQSIGEKREFSQGLFLFLSSL